jgi:hypothetical protein
MERYAWTETQLMIMPTTFSGDSHRQVRVDEVNWLTHPSVELKDCLAILEADIAIR